MPEPSAQKPKKIESDSNTTAPAVSLNQLLNNKPSTRELEHRQNAQRVLVITSMARIDDDLIRLLRAVLAPTGGDEDNLLDEGRPLGSLMLRAKLCLRLRLISPNLYELIKQLSEIRNDCSHKPDSFDVFRDPSVQDKISNYWGRLNSELFDPTITDAAERFKLITSYINIYLVILTRESKGGVLRNSEYLFVKQ